MAGIKRFEDIEAWQLSRKLVNEVYRLSAAGSFARDFGLRDQMRRAAVSILSNIAEGFEREGNKEFLQFLSLAKGSCGEVRAQLYVALDQGYLKQAEFAKLSDEAIQVSRLIAGFMRYLRKTEMRGSKFLNLEP